MILGIVLKHNDLTQLSFIVRQKFNKTLKRILRPLYNGIVFIENIKPPDNWKITNKSQISSNSFKHDLNKLDIVFDKIIESFYNFSTRFFEGDVFYKSDEVNILLDGIEITDSEERVYYWYFDDSDDDKLHANAIKKLKYKKGIIGVKLFYQLRVSFSDILYTDIFKLYFPKLGNIF